MSDQNPTTTPDITPKTQHHTNHEGGIVLPEQGSSIVEGAKSGLVGMIATCLAVACLPMVASASWLFDAGDTVTVADNAALTLPANDWTIVGWIKPPGSSSNWRGLMSWGSGDQSISINIQAVQSYPSSRIWAFYQGSAGSAQWTFGGTVACDANGDSLTIQFVGGTSQAQVQCDIDQGLCKDRSPWERVAY